MSKYTQYYYNGDTYEIDVRDDGVVLDITDDTLRRKLYDADYRDGLAKTLKSLYKRKKGKDLGNIDEISAEILLHAEGYDFAQGLDGIANTKALAITAPILYFAAANPISQEFGDWLYERSKEVNSGENNELLEQGLYKAMATDTSIYEVLDRQF